MSIGKKVSGRIERMARRMMYGAGANLMQLSAEDRRYLNSAYDSTVPLPPDADERLSPQHPRLLELRERYAALDLPVLGHSVWNPSTVEQYLDLRHFRGENPFVWHYRELPRATELKFFVYLKYLEERDRHGLLRKLTEDGAFGCWTFDYEGYGKVSRDMLDSVNELLYLDRQVGLFARQRLRVLDIGAGYGRVAHRMRTAVPGLVDYCCVDAIPESSFVCEYYLGYRGSTPVARMLPLDEVETRLAQGAFDLALNLHSFSECTLAAVHWWMGQLQRLRVPRLMITPNEPEGMLSTEADGSRLELLPIIEQAGYRLTQREPVLADPAVRRLLRLKDHFHMFELAAG